MWSNLSLSILLFYSVACVEKKICRDDFLGDVRKCHLLKGKGYCENGTDYFEFMQANCAKTCGFCKTYTKPCPEGYFSCLGGKPDCLEISKMCDCTADCDNGHDEFGCDGMVECSTVGFNTLDSNATTPTPGSVTNTPDNGTNPDKGSGSKIDVERVTEVTEEPGELGNWLKDNGIKCPNADEVGCSATKECMKAFKWCDGWYDDCPDGEDEDPHCYYDVNKNAFKNMYVNGLLSVDNFLEALLKLKHTHCRTRQFSCAAKDACFDEVDLYSYKCACDVQCWARKDCCHDVEEMCGVQKPEGVIEECGPRLFGKDEEMSGLVVSRCPESASVHDAERCADSGKPEETMFYGAPVYDPGTDKHYLNYYCARCNGVTSDDLTPWNVWFDCNEVEESENCGSLLYIPPLNHPPNTCREKVFTDPSFDDRNVTVGQKDNLAVERCQTVYAPVLYEDRIYRNPYCLYMHRSQLGDRNWKKIYTCDFEGPPEHCPDDRLPCRDNFSCLPLSVECDGIVDCANEGSDEHEGCEAMNDCYRMFRCKRTQHECLPMYYRCDSSPQCTDKSDEEGCTVDEDNEIVYRNNFQNSLSQRLSGYPRISNSYKEPETTVTTPSAFSDPHPQCIHPLIYNGNSCKFNGSISEDRAYTEVHMKQELSAIVYQITLTPLGHHRPLAMRDNPITFLANHLQHYPYQIVEFKMSELTPDNTREVHMVIRELTKLEKIRGVEVRPTRAKRFADNYLQIDTEVYQIHAELKKTESQETKLKSLTTKINCEFDSSGLFVQALCTGCAYEEFTESQYVYTEAGLIMVKHNGRILQYWERELRANGKILACMDTPNVNSTDAPSDTAWKGLGMTIWFGVGYALAFIVHVVALAINIYSSRKTTLRIFFINYTAFGLGWSFDSMLCAVSSVYSRAMQSFHLYGNMGTLAWLLIISFHLLLSVSDGSPAVYFSVDNLVYYHVCGWLCPLGWILLFFLLSTFKVTENVGCLTDPQQNLNLNGSSEILHFPVWVLILVVLFLLLIVIGTTKRLMAGKPGSIDMDVMGCRLKIKIMVFCLFMIQALPWVITLLLKYVAQDFKYHGVFFCLGCILESYYLIYILRMLIKGNLEKIGNSTSDYTKANVVGADISTPELKPALPPKTRTGPRPPIYQRPIDHNYTPFPDHHRRTQQNDFADQYSHLQGGNLGGRSGKKKGNYPVTHLGSPANSASRNTPTFSQEHQYMPIVHSDSSPAASPAGAARARQRTTSSQGSVPVFTDPTQIISDKGKHRVPRSALADQSNSSNMDRDQSDLPPPYQAENRDIHNATEVSQDRRSSQPPAYEASCEGAEHETGV